jgi:DNA-binding response OmpR family regulator
MIPYTPPHKPEDTARPGENPKVHPLLVFSPDPDVAKSLTMLLEENYAVESETDLSKLEEHINRVNPPIMLVDLYAFPADILKTVEVLKRRQERNPVILFHVYRTSRPEIEQAIRSVSDIVLYKPINTDLVAELTSVLMAVHKGERTGSTVR